LKSLVRRYFYFPTVSGAHDLCSNNSDVFHISYQGLTLGKNSLDSENHSSLSQPSKVLCWMPQEWNSQLKEKKTSFGAVLKKVPKNYGVTTLSMLAFIITTLSIKYTHSHS